MIDLHDVQRRVAGNSLITSVATVPKGHVRIETAFLYPEGSNIDLFLVEDAPLLPATRLSDLGQTFSWLLDVQVRPWQSKKRQAFVEDALRIYGAHQNGGALDLSLPTLDELVPSIMRLGQACVRVADLVYTRRSSLQTPVIEEIEELLADTSLEYQPNVELEGRFGNRVRVDFLVSGSHSKSALLTLSSQNTSQAHALSVEIFRRWYDLDVPTRTEQRVTILDDRYDTYRDEDLSRLRDKSAVVWLSDRRTIGDLLAA